MEEAVQNVCKAMEKEISDYLLLKNVLLKQFSNNPSLIRWLEILEANMYGNWPMYICSTRYYAVWMRNKNIMQIGFTL